MTTQLIDVEKIVPNGWNPNVMPEAEYEALKQDMRVHGVNGVDPILVSLKGVYQLEGEITGEAWTKAFNVKGYIIVDGEHRWRIAKELGWKQILCTTEAIKEEDAKALCYRRNRERGTIDPFKEAALFKSDMPKLTQAKIAGKYGVDQSTVSKRLSLLNLDFEVAKEIEAIPRGILTTSHLEPISTLEPEDQKAVIKSVKQELKWNREGLSSRRIQSEVEELKKERAEQRALAKALETAKFPKCPRCGEKPSNKDHQGLPWVHCRNFHTSWNLNTGKKEYDFDEESAEKGEGPQTRAPMTLRSMHTAEEIADVFITRIKEVIANVSALKIAKIDVSGKLNGIDFSFDINTYGKSMSVSWHYRGAYFGFRAENHDYKTGEKTAVTTGSPGELPQIQELIENAFKGKLGINPKTKKKSKKPQDDLDELHSELLEADSIKVTDNPAEALSAERETEEETK